MKSRLKKQRQSRWFHKCIAQNTRPTPLFEKLEERQLMSGAMYVGTNLESVVPSSSGDVWVPNASSPQGGWYDSLPADSTPFNDLMKNANWTSTDTDAVTRITFRSGAGLYTLKASGNGTISFGDPNLANNGRQEFSFDGNNQTRTLQVVGNASFFANVKIESGSLSNISLVKQGLTGTFDTHFTDVLQPFSTLRFMDWGRTNNSELTTWDQRVHTTDYQGITGHEGVENDATRITVGVALEYMVELANQTGQNAWFTVPAEVDDDYIAQMALYIKNNLDPNLKAFIEYSNETWNTQFSSYHYAVIQGEAQGWGTGHSAGNRWVAHRSAAIWKIFTDVFDENGQNPGQSTNRLVKVIGSQSNAVSVTEQRLAAFKDTTYNPDQIMPDAVAIAPYFTKPDVISRHLTGTTPATLAFTAEFQNLENDEARKNKILSDVHNEISEHLDNIIDAHKTITDANGLWLTAYEGGQHLTASGFVNDQYQPLHAEDMKELIEILVAANRDPQMYDLYSTYLNTLRDKGISLYNNFTATYAPGKWGSWGLKEHQDQPISQAHKYRATQDWVTNAPASSFNLAPIARTNGTNNQIVAIADNSGNATIQLDGTASSDLDGTLNRNSSYQWMLDGQTVSNQAAFSHLLAVGNYTFALTVTDNQGATNTRTVDVIVTPEGAGGTVVQSNFVGNTANFQNNAGIALVEILTGSWMQRKANDNGVVFRSTHDTIEQSPFNTNQYLAFKATPHSDKTVDYRGTTFDFTINRPSYHSHRQFILKSSIDGFNQAIGLPMPAFNDHGADADQAFKITLPASDIYQTSQPVEFRLYAYGSSYGHDTRLKAITLHGSVADNGSTPNPDPNTDDVNIVSDFSDNSAGGWSFGAGTANVVTANGLGFTAHHSSDQTESSKAVALSSDLYIQRTLAAGNDLRGAQLDFTMERYNWNSARRFFVTANGVEIYDSGTAFTGTGEHDFSTTLGQQSALDGSQPIDFKIYTYGGFWYGQTTLRAFSLQGVSSPSNQAPNAIASNVNRVGPGNVVLNASASSDPDGDNLSFVWKNSNGNIVGNTALVTTAINVGSHPFTVTVTDGDLTATRTITATATPANDDNDDGNDDGNDNASGTHDTRVVLRFDDLHTTRRPLNPDANETSAPPRVDFTIRNRSNNIRNHNSSDRDRDRNESDRDSGFYTYRADTPSRSMWSTEPKAAKQRFNWSFMKHFFAAIPHDAKLSDTQKSHPSVNPRQAASPKPSDSIEADNNLLDELWADHPLRQTRTPHGEAQAAEIPTDEQTPANPNTPTAPEAQAGVSPN